MLPMPSNQPVRMRQPRPVMTAMKNPCACKGGDAPQQVSRRNPVSVVGGGATVGGGGSTGAGVSPTPSSDNQFQFRWWNNWYPYSWWGGGWPYSYGAYPYSYSYYPYNYSYGWPYYGTPVYPQAAYYSSWAGWPNYGGWGWPYSPYTAYVPRAPIVAAAA